MEVAEEAKKLREEEPDQLFLVEVEAPLLEEVDDIKSEDDGNNKEIIIGSGDSGSDEEDSDSGDDE